MLSYELLSQKINELPELYKKHGWRPRRGIPDKHQKLCCALHIISLDVIGHMEPFSYGVMPAEAISFAFGFDGKQPGAGNYVERFWVLGNEAYCKIANLCQQG